MAAHRGHASFALEPLTASLGRNITWYMPCDGPNMTIILALYQGAKEGNKCKNVLHAYWLAAGKNSSTPHQRAMSAAYSLLKNVGFSTQAPASEATQFVNGCWVVLLPRETKTKNIKAGWGVGGPGSISLQRTQFSLVLLGTVGWSKVNQL